MTERPYDPAADAIGSYYAARKLQREALLRAGLTEPIDDTERAIVEAARKREAAE